MKKRNYLIGGILAAVFCLVIAILSLANRPACTSERPMGDGGERSFLASVVEQTDTRRPGGAVGIRDGAKKR